MYIFGTYRRNLIMLLMAFVTVFPTSVWAQRKKDKKDNNTADTTLVDSKSQKDGLDAEVYYQAEDSIIFTSSGKAYLYGNASLLYKDIDIKADIFDISMDSTIIRARGRLNEEDELIGKPVYKDKSTEFESKELAYNLKTKKGFIRHTVTQQGEGYVISDKTKKNPDNSLYITGGKYTTCDNHEHPHFYLALTKARVEHKKNIVSGPAYLVLLDVPLPLALPFGFFPFTENYSSGIIMPTFGDDFTRGFYASNGGYYFAFSKYFDLTLLGEIYTKGTWSASLASTYVKRYKFRGNISANYREDVISEKSLPDYERRRNFNLNWTHTQDQKSSPNSTFSASVNFSTGGYARSNIHNYYRPELLSQNTTSSSVSFTQRFPGSPFAISANVLATQRAQDSTINLTLPNITISMNTVYPFKRKNPVGKDRWYEKISIGYTGQISNSINSKENKLLKSSFVRDWKNGINHSIPLNAPFSLFRYITITPSFNYQERWYFKSIDRAWDSENRTEMPTDTTTGFYRVFDFSTGISMQTKLYGFYTPIRKIFGNKIDRIRHVVTPSIGFSYRPDFGRPYWKYYRTYERDGEMVQYSRFKEELYGTPAIGESASLNWSLANNLEMKVRTSKIDSITGESIFKKISLIDNFSLSGSYNFIADSLNWSDISANIRLKIYKEFSINLSGAFDLYAYTFNKDNRPVRVNVLRWDIGKLPYFKGTSTAFGYTFSNATFKKKEKNTDKMQTQANVEEMEEFENPEPVADKKKKDDNIGEDGYQKFSMPWSLRVDYSVQYGVMGNEYDEKNMAPKRKFSHNLNFSGNWTITPKWRINFSAAYDITNNKLNYTSLGISRDLHCWTMSASVVPFGPYKSYNFHISVNSSLLSDIKYDRQSRPENAINWF